MLAVKTKLSNEEKDEEIRAQKMNRCINEMRAYLLFQGDKAERYRRFGHLDSSSSCFDFLDD